MSARHKILLLDDDPDMVEIYREILQRLPGQPDIQTTTTANRALTMLEAQPFTMLVTDLSMPKIDGLQLLATVRRRWPHVRTVAMSSIVDDQLRKRAQAMGVDIFCEKPSTSHEIETFLTYVDALLKKALTTAASTPLGEPTLAEVLRLEGLGRNSSVIRVLYGEFEGRLWVQDGEVIDAVGPGMAGDDALRMLMSWSGTKCEVLPAEPGHPKRITAPAGPAPAGFDTGLRIEPAAAPPPASTPPPAPRPPQSGGTTLLTLPGRTLNPLKAAAPAAAPPPTPPPAAAPLAPRPAVTPLAELARYDGVAFILSLRASGAEPATDSWGVENPEALGQWTRGALERFRRVGEHLQAGRVVHFEVIDGAHRIAVEVRPEGCLLVGFKRTLVPEQARETMKLILSKWAS